MREHMGDVDKLFRKYDSNSDGLLDRGETALFFQDYCRYNNLLPGKGNVAALSRLADTSTHTPNGCLSQADLVSFLSSPAFQSHYQRLLHADQVVCPVPSCPDLRLISCPSFLLLLFLVSNG